MIDFNAIEYFFAGKDSHPIPHSLVTDNKPTAPLKKRIIRSAPVAKPAPPAKQEEPKPQAIASSKKPPKKKEEDSFYKEWEQKYKALHAENLLAKEPFKRHALFVVGTKEPKEFAEKIAGAINTRLMKTTLVFHDGDVTALIDKYHPTHLVLSEGTTATSTLPTLSIESLKTTEKEPAKKRSLWESLKNKLKG